jgi:nucleoside-diphosphate-sugar epimerase
MLTQISGDKVVLVTGAKGFVGKAVVAELLRCGYQVVAIMRDATGNIKFDNCTAPCNLQWRIVQNINKFTDWEETLNGVNVIVHLAARAHVNGAESQESIRKYHETNVQGTMQLARAAVKAGVSRFVFLSSIGVNGNRSRVPFTEEDPPNPCGAYAKSKFDAERNLIQIAQQTDMEFVILRPPLVYGPKAPGNFGRLLRILKTGIPLPLGKIQNLRSVVALDNLVNLIVLCSDRDRSPKAANQLFLVADGEDISTADLLRKIAAAGGYTIRLINFPIKLLRAIARMFGGASIIDRLVENLQVDSTKVRSMLGWSPVVSVDEQLTRVFEDINKKLEP